MKRLRQSEPKDLRVLFNLNLPLTKYQVKTVTQVFERLAAGELDGRPDAWTHSALCLAFRRGEQHSAVLEVYKMMREQEMPIYKDVFYAALEACERLGLWREGQDVLRHVQVTFCRYIF